MEVCGECEALKGAAMPSANATAAGECASQALGGQAHVMSCFIGIGCVSRLLQVSEGVDQ
jgi:hypothetical protein